MSAWEVVIGLEVHVQLSTASKLFCGCSTRFGEPPNTQICPICTGQPGVLPALNQQAVDFALRLALALGCTVRERSRFARKNYFYPDLPKGYQISQYDEPLAEAGAVEIWQEGRRQRLGITRLHLEEDAGKNIHQPAGGCSLVDLNRAGVPLLEIVSEPDLREPATAAEAMRTLRSIVRALQISDGNMEQGSLRCDANISVRRAGEQQLGAKVEIKNLNSFRFVQKALEYEATRQQQQLGRGEPIVTETRLWNTELGITQSMRSKEQAHDYRYFPEPDLPPLLVEQAWIERRRAELPELPNARRARFIEEYGLSDYDAGELTREHELATYFEQTVASGAPAKRAANWILSELLAQVPDPRDVATAPVSPAALGGLLALWEEGRISGKLAKAIWPKMWTSGRSALEIATAEQLFVEEDESLLEQQIVEVLAAHPAQLAEYRAGKQKLWGFFVGKIMQATGGKANPQRVNALLKQHLEG